MENYLSGMPVWAIALFIIGFLYGISFIANPARQAALNAGMSVSKARNIWIGVFGFYVIYLAYVSILSLKGVFDVNSLPPRVMIWAGLPLMIILFGFIGNTRLFKTLLQSITLESLIAIHVFRVLGIFFIFLYGYHLLPAKFSFFAGLGDVITAIFALPVARLVSKRRPGWKAAVYIWNIFGIMDIFDLLTIATVTAANGGGNLREMTVFPFVWFPAFAPATILFLHTVVFRKLYQIKKPAIIVAMAVGLIAGTSFYASAQGAGYLTVSNKFVDVEGVKYAYRILGKKSEYPLVLLQHFRGSMDNWDPALIDALANQRTVIVFDNKGIGLTGGETPDSFEAMGDDAASFITALGYKKVDVLGFSIGGAVAQTLTLHHPDLVRKLILAGTAPKGGAKINERDPKIIDLVTHATSESEVFLATFYAPTQLSQTLGKASLARRQQRSKVFDKATSIQTLQAHTAARKAWGMPADSTFGYLKQITQPVLVANGSDDIMMFTVNSYTLYQHLPDARLILYPNSAHGFLFQYPLQFAKDAGDFLDSELK